MKRIILFLATNFLVVIAVSLIPIMTLYGPQAALIAESFSPRLRYSGAGIGYQRLLDKALLPRVAKRLGIPR